MNQKLELLQKQNEQAIHCGGEKAVAKQHSLGKYTARERIEKFLDAGSFHETGRFVTHRCTDFNMSEKVIPADGVITGYGTVNGRKVFVYAQDFTASGGSMGKMQAEKICALMDLASEAGAPLIAMHDSGGARIQEGVDALSGYGNIFRRNAMNSGKIPQIALMMGPCAGGATYSPALMDFIIMVDQESKMFVTGPSVVKSISGEDVTADQLGGASIHAAKSGVSHFLVKNDDEALEYAKQLLGYLPDNCNNKPQTVPYLMNRDSVYINQVIPDDDSPYDMYDIIDSLIDERSFLEVQKEFAQNIIVGFARMNGHSIGIVANQPLVKGGYLDIDASDKGARFINFCDAFNIPLINLVDVPGFVPGTQQEHAGVIRHGAKMLYAYATAEIAKITVIVRKAFGGGYMSMCSKEMGADMVFAWPSAEIAVMGAEGAVSVISHKEIEAALDPQAKKDELIKDYKDKFANPYFAAKRGYVDSVIEPNATRNELIAGLELLENKQHPDHKGNMPL